MDSLIQTAPAAPRPAAAPQAPQRRPSALPLLLASLTTGGLLWLCYFPVNCGWLAWFALVPLLFLVRSTARPSLVYLCAYAGGLTFFGPALQWMRVADPRMIITWIFLALYCSIYFPLGLFFVRFLDRRTGLPLALTLPVVWTALEFFRSVFCTGFSWYLLGHTQHDFLHVIQFADLTGGYGVSFLVAAVNAVLFEAIYRRGRLWTGAFLIQAGAVAAALVAALGYGDWRLRQDAFTPGPRVALIQGNVPQQIRNDVNMADVMATHFVALSDLAAAQKPDLIVWPETSFPGADWCDADPDAPAPLPNGWGQRMKDCRSLMRKASEEWGTNLLIGLDSGVCEADGHTHHYNSALLVGRDGKPLGRYDKIHCVPFGEYVPLRDVFPWMQAFAPYDDQDYSVSPGRSETRFPLDGGTDHAHSFGVAICYEDTDPDRTRPYGGGDGRPPADFLLNISNDGWFDGTSEHDEHLAICRFRAVECRRSVGRAVNMGISAVIDGNGRVLPLWPVAGTEWDNAGIRKTIMDRLDALPADTRSLAVGLFPDDGRAAVWRQEPSRGMPNDLPTGQWAHYKKVPGILVADIPIDRRVSLYALWGDWLPWGCWVLVGAGFVLAFGRPRRTSDIRVTHP